MKWLSIHLPIPILFLLEVMMTRKFIKNKNEFTFSIIFGGFLSSLMSILWTLDPIDQSKEPLRHLLAKIIIVGSFMMIATEVYMFSIKDQSSSRLNTRICFSLIKPMLLLNGRTFQIALVACIGQHLALS